MITENTHKECKRCKKHLLIKENFYKNGGKNRNSYHTYCKSCLIAQTVIRQRETKRICVEYKGGKCVKCGYDKCLSALDFHHLDPTKKDFKISKKMSRRNLCKEHMDELDKCILVCSNCHREIHESQRKEYMF